VRAGARGRYAAYFHAARSTKPGAPGPTLFVYLLSADEWMERKRIGSVPSRMKKIKKNKKRLPAAADMLRRELFQLAVCGR